MHIAVRNFTLGLIATAAAVAPVSQSAEAGSAEFVAVCSRDDGLGSAKICQCIFDTAQVRYTGLERRFVERLYTETFADLTAQPSGLAETRQDTLLDEGFELAETCGAKFKP